MAVKLYEFREEDEHFGVLEGPEDADMAELFNEFAVEIGLTFSGHWMNYRYWVKGNEGPAGGQYWFIPFLNWLEKKDGWRFVKTTLVRGDDL